MKITFNTDNAAFQYDPVDEIARTIRNIAERVESGESEGKIRDINGNSIGSFDTEL